jgi:hypothetical protein
MICASKTDDDNDYDEARFMCCGGPSGIYKG